MIKGVGVDIVEVERIRGAIRRHGQRFLRRIYSSDEIEYCLGRAHPDQGFAARFAAKEAVLKALGTGWQYGARFTDVTVIKDVKGAPAVRLSGKSLQTSNELGISRIHISLSHTESHAVAQAVAEGPVRAEE